MILPESSNRHILNMLERPQSNETSVGKEGIGWRADVAPYVQAIIGALGGVRGMGGPISRGASIPTNRPGPGANVNEYTQQAAINIGGRNYTGNSHLQAAENAAKALGVHEDEIFRLMSMADRHRTMESDGFLTNTGRFVDRREGLNLVHPRHSIPEGTSSTRHGQLTSEDLVNAIMGRPPNILPERMR